MIPIQYIKGSALEPVGNGYKFIVHCCNDAGLWGAGFVLAINKQWHLPFECYKKWHENVTDPFSTGRFQLGEVQFVPVEKGIIVVNMIGQHGVRSRTNPVPIKYDAIRKCLIHVRERIHVMMHEDARNHYTNDLALEGYGVHGPRFGCTLAGGNWNEMEKIIEQELSNYKVSVTIYDL